jgi:hypothetical protein
MDRAAIDRRHGPAKRDRCTSHRSMRAIPSPPMRPMHRRSTPHGRCSLPICSIRRGNGWWSPDSTRGRGFAPLRKRQAGRPASVDCSGLRGAHWPTAMCPFWWWDTIIPRASPYRRSPTGTPPAGSRRCAGLPGYGWRAICCSPTRNACCSADRDEAQHCRLPAGGAAPIAPLCPAPGQRHGRTPGSRSGSSSAW